MLEKERLDSLTVLPAMRWGRLPPWAMSRSSLETDSPAAPSGLLLVLLTRYRASVAALVLARLTFLRREAL